MFLSRCAVVLVFTYTAMLFSIGEGCADPIDGLTLTQLMIENQGQDSFILGSAYGVDLTSPIPFTTNVDLASMSYSYNSMAGLLYEGQPLSIVGTGSFNSSTNTLTTTSNITLGPNTLSAPGTVVVDLLANPKTDSFKRTFPPFPVPGGTAYDEECDSLQFPSGRSLDTCQYTRANGTPFGPAFTSADNYNTLTGAWTFDQSSIELGVGVAIAGLSAPTGGFGSSEATLSVPIPEPPALTMLAFALAVLGARKFLGGRSRGLTCARNRIKSRAGESDPAGPRRPHSHLGEIWVI